MLRKLTRRIKQWRLISQYYWRWIWMSRAEKEEERKRIAQVRAMGKLFSNLLGNAPELFLEYDTRTREGHNGRRSTIRKGGDR